MRHLKHVVKNRVVRLGVGLAVTLTVGYLAINYIATNVKAQSPAATAAAEQPSHVGTVTVKPQQVRTWSEFSGRLQAVDFAEVRPEVSGRITGIRFKEGQTVSAGTVLFVIDPRPFEAAVAKAEATLATARTNAEFAQTELERASKMIQTQAIAQRLYDERANADRVARAAISMAEAELKQARIDLDHAYVKAPISGRISRAEITLGNRVQAGAGAPVLSSIVSDKGIYADFEVDEQTYLTSIRSHADTSVKERRIPVELTVQGDDVHPYRGTIQSFDNRIDPGSGTIRARARFENENGALIPGMFVAVRLASSGDNSVLLVPERAVGNDQSKKFVYVVGNGDKVVYREVKLGQQAQGGRIVLSGVQPGDRVITDGLQHVKPEMIVRATEVAGPQATERLAANDRHALDRSGKDTP
ncbi:efflux RND transporter periplasmic adaptor subunit [Geobacter sp. SVR]|uniref:efflux RND transporter periplasmic adaptor subunit n=1 Tax=Geobacter sp. SVR TaxID=2495594 RepID=UPI00143EFB5D|nr:efflux RND transporter periplasmic adaptor subunit [Geobacter sp. SVR]BCS55277.1 MexE family multidrug efflux RND transporter periplasmic adaptor subunit [Geobacter sp. SVR]GCF86076.1 MexE family multidrug efflux RND transporter periplasmic adaptor subunit [Geobacter sp. SVR]